MFRSRNASHVHDSTQSRTRRIAPSSRSRASSRSRNSARSSRASIDSISTFEPAGSTHPPRARLRISAHHDECTTARSQRRNRRESSYWKPLDRRRKSIKTACVTSSASASCNPQRRHHFRNRGAYVWTNRVQTSASNGCDWSAESTVMLVSGMHGSAKAGTPESSGFGRTRPRPGRLRLARIIPRFNVRTP